MKRTIFIGDIHGCYKEFKLLLKKLQITSKDKIYLVGDIINRGPKSFKVLKFLYKNQEQFKSVIGNHEMNFLGRLKGNKYTYDKKIFKKLKKKTEKYPKYLEYLEKLPKYIEENNFLVIHGGLIPGKALNEHTIDEITKTRDYNGKPWYEYYKGNKKIIYGHWGYDGLRIRKNTIGLDGSCVYGKRLIAYILETGEIISQNALDIYINLYKNKDIENENTTIKKI